MDDVGYTAHDGVSRLHARCVYAGEKADSILVWLRITAATCWYFREDPFQPPMLPFLPRRGQLSITYQHTSEYYIYK